MTFYRRLAIVLSVLWIAIVFTSYAIDGYDSFPWELVMVHGVFPVAACWGFGWLISGWQRR